jgi:hypothetical protein
MRQKTREDIEGDEKCHQEQIHPKIGAGLVRLHFVGFLAFAS